MLPNRMPLLTGTPPPCSPPLKFHIFQEFRFWGWPATEVLQSWQLWFRVKGRLFAVDLVVQDPALRPYVGVI